MNRPTAHTTNGCDRRGFLKLAVTAPWLTGLANAADDEAPRQRILNYLESLRQPDGGYGWGDQPRSHLTPTYGVVGSYQVLGATPPRRDALIEFVQTHHPFHLKKLERELKAFEFQQIQALRWLGADASRLEPQVLSWTRPFHYTERYERNGYPVFEFEVMAFIGRDLLGLPMDTLSPEFVTYVDSRRRANGSFNNTPADDGSDGHMLNTWWGLRALQTLGRGRERRGETVRWVQACQLPSGGFTWQPDPPMAGNDDVAYIWAALRILEMLDAAPERAASCRDYLLSLWNSDGGFGPRPGWDSNPLATYYALDALRALQQLETLSKHPRKRQRPSSPTLPDGLQVFTIQIQAHGRGSPTEAVDLARALRIHLWGAKNAAPDWIETAQAIADRQRVPVRFFVANEEYGTFVGLPGLGVYSHTSDIIAPAGAEIGPSLAQEKNLSWEAFRERRLRPLQQAGGRLVWQFNENEALTRLYLDDSLQRGGYAAISTFHFGNPDFTNSEPFLKLYRNQIPYVALQDAHGDEAWWWGDQLTGFRTLFLATEPTWDGWLTALKHNWVVAVRHDAVSGFQTWRHGGPVAVLDFVQQHEPEWRWWDNPQIERPVVSLVAVKPDDRFETGRPEQGVTLRVRCQWENTAQGLPKRPRVEFVRLLVDDREVPARLHTEGPPNRRTDVYHSYHWAEPTPGNHQATAVVRQLDAGIEAQRTIVFPV